MAKYCVRCGSKNPTRASVCSSCGSPLGGQSNEQFLMDFSASVSSERSNVDGDNGYEEESKSSYFLNLSQKTFDFEKLIHNTILTDENLITEISCQNDFIYILNEGADFLSTEYKVLNSMGNKGLLKCKRIQYNGKTAIYYMAGKLKSLEVMLQTLDSIRFLCVVENILNQVKSIKENGFLVDTGIDIRIERIYIDGADGQVYLTYVPIKRRNYHDVVYLENDLRKNLAYIIRSSYDSGNANINMIVQMLEESGCSLSNILSAVRRCRSVSSITKKY